MVFQIGDRVKIKSHLLVGFNYGLGYFTPEMSDFKGKIAKVVWKDPYSMYYKLDIDHMEWYWYDEMLERIDDIPNQSSIDTMMDVIDYLAYSWTKLNYVDKRNLIDNFIKTVDNK